jgi:hypothetical protein
MGRTTMLALLISVAGLVITSAASAQAGQLDTAFGGDGRVATDVTARGDMATSVAMVPAVVERRKATSCVARSRAFRWRGATSGLTPCSGVSRGLSRATPTSPEALGTAPRRSPMALRLRIRVRRFDSSRGHALH